MEVSFYPGCSLQGMAHDYAHSVVMAFDDLEIKLVEIDDWSCCGATAAHSLSEMMSVAFPARNLAQAEKIGLDIVAPCANCFNRLRYSQHMLKKKLFDIPWEVKGGLIVHEITRFVGTSQRLEQIRGRVVNPLKGLRLVAYYGCQLVRPPRITGFTDYENPQTLDRIAAATGAEVIDWSYKTTCCGASIGIGRKDIQMHLTRRLLEKVRRAGADAIVVSCPLCQQNLDSAQSEADSHPLPVFYFTELLRLAFHRSANEKWFSRHFTDPVPVLDRRGLLR